MRPIITRRNPIELHNPPGYHHVTVASRGRVQASAVPFRGSARLDVFGALVSAVEDVRAADRSLPMPLWCSRRSAPAPIRSSVRSFTSSARTPRFWPQPGASSPSRASDRRSVLRALLGVRCLGFSASSSKSTSLPPLIRRPPLPMRNPLFASPTPAGRLIALEVAEAPGGRRRRRMLVRWLSGRVGPDGRRVAVEASIRGSSAIWVSRSRGAIDSRPWRPASV